MTSPTARVERRVCVDFGDSADVVLADLATVPESLPLADRQDAERLHAAIVLASKGDLTAFGQLLDLARTDWRDLLVVAGLADGDWPQRLDQALAAGEGRGA